ncbi:hypothetical protein EGW08_017789 [Elysia chlorotica]|uniref:G-protein coupled receptors family 1 profile domain-containing protein n=1 Tax=Elysia chlorotica TaxID=188477 RepID=A0A433SYR8_ELYCH|nr:hypothetical protein EGW08_017789 [Elysia chlorotica]
MEDADNNTTNGSVPFLVPPSRGDAMSPLVSFYVYKLFRIVIDLALIFSLALFGCLSNVINIIVYLKMGLADTTTINILALSTLDFLACATTLLTVMSFSPFTAGWTLPSGAGLLELGFGAFIVYYPAVTCGAWVTALLSVERCLCIVFPLKIKTLVTARRTTLLIASMVLYQFVFICLMYIETGPPYIPSPTNGVQQMDEKNHWLATHEVEKGPEEDSQLDGKTALFNT